MNYKLLIHSAVIIILLLTHSSAIFAGDVEKFDSLIAKSDFYVEKNPELCQKYANEAKEYVTKEIENHIIKESIGLSSMFAGDDSVGTVIFNELLNYYTENNNTNNLIYLYTNYGYYYLSASNYSLALEYFLKAKEFAIKLSDYKLLCYIYRNLGNLNNLQHNYKGAHKYYQQLNDLANEINNGYNKIYSLYALALLNDDIHNYSKSDSLLNSALKLINNSEGNYQSIKYNIYHKKGLSKLKIMDYDSAYYFLKHAFNPNDKNTDKITLYGNLGKFFIKTNKPDSALHYLQLAENIDTNNIRIGNIYKLYADSYIEIKEYKEAQPYIKKAYNALLEKQKFPDLIDLILQKLFLEKDAIIRKELIQKLQSFQDSVIKVKNQLVLKNIESELNVVHSYQLLQKDIKYEKQKNSFLIIIIGIISLFLIIISLAIVKIKKQNKMLKTDYKILVSGSNHLSGQLKVEMKTLLHKIFAFDEKESKHLNQESSFEILKDDLQQIFDNIEYIIKLLQKQINKHNK